MKWKWPKWPLSRPAQPLEPPPKKRIGLALSGGAVRGIAHLGVLEVLDREGVRPDAIAGVSAGSIVGALYAAGYTAEQLTSLALELKWSRLVRLQRPRLSLFDTTRLEQYMDELLAGKTFDQLPTPFVAMAVDILTSTEIPLSKGSVARAVRASCAIPGLFSPVEQGDHLLVDGGLLNNVPVQILREMGMEYIIAVDVMSTQGPYSRPHNIFEMWMLSAFTLMRTAYSELSQADCVIQPDIGKLSFVDFAQAPELLARGRQAAEEKLGQIRNDLNLPLPPLLPAGREGEIEAAPLHDTHKGTSAN